MRTSAPPTFFVISETKAEGPKAITFFILMIAYLNMTFPIKPGTQLTVSV